MKQRSGTRIELKEGERKYLELAAQLPQTVFELDASGDKVFINRFGCQLFGHTPKGLKAGLNILLAWQMKIEKRSIRTSIWHSTEAHRFVSTY